MSSEQIHRRYARLLRWCSRGHALYFPAEADQAQPGSVGIFNQNGRWFPLCQHVSSAQFPLQPYLGDLQTATQDQHRSETFASKELSSLAVRLGGSLENSRALSTSVKAQIEAAVNKKEAAFLLCGPISWEGIALKRGDLKQWGKENAERILSSEPETRTHGFFIISGITRTKWCHFKYWSETVRSFSPTLTTQTPHPQSSPTEITVDGSESNEQSGWVICETEKGREDVDFVVFVEGYLFIPRLFGYMQVDENRNYRSPDGDEDIDSKTIFFVDNVLYEVTCEEWTSQEIHIRMPNT